MYHIKAIPEAPPGGLDLNIADEDEFSPDKLRSNIERLYMTVIVGMIGFGNHIARLRSWREPRRTGAFAAVFFIAWIFNLAIPALFAMLLVLITVPEARPILFPPAPLALVSKTGGVKTPPAGVLGSHDSVTGAPEKYKGEAVEQEASNLVSGIASVAISSAAGRHDQASPDEKSGSESLDAGAPDPTRMASAAADAAASATGGDADPIQDRTKQPMEEAVWTKMRPAMHAIGDISDGWERFANALEPTPPFSSGKKYQLGAIVAPLLLASLFTSAHVFVKMNTLITLIAFFTDPLMQRAIAILNEKIPNWPQYLELRNTLLKGVPTNAQLTITLLRIGEANRAPLPPPPSSSEPPPEKPAELDKQALIEESGLDATHSEIEDAINVDQPSGSDENAGDTPKKKAGFGSKVMSAFRHTTAAGVETKLTGDVARATLGSKHAKDKLGILPSKRELRKKATDGPVVYSGRSNGQKGAVYVDSSVSPATTNPPRPESPCIYFTTRLDGDETVESSKTQPQWAVSIRDIAEIKKVGGLGWKGKIVVGWATSREVKDGIEITARVRGVQDGDGKAPSTVVYRAMAIKERDELFNRIASMGQQVWESY